MVPPLGMLPSLPGRLVALAGLPLALAACTTSGTSGTSGPAPTMVSLDPAYFLGDVACSAAPGGMQSYVATILDVTDPGKPFVMPSALATACSLPVGFYFVLPGHTYIATIDGYEAPAATLTPCGGATSGARRMLPAGKTDCARDALAPRWTASCGQTGGSAAVSVESSNVIMSGCEALVDHGASATGILLDPTAALGALACATASGGDVATFDVTPLDGASAPVVGLACGAPPLQLSSGVEPGVTYSFLVAGRKAPTEPASWGSVCRATAIAGLTVTASCDPLAAKGGIRVDVPALFASAGVACNDGAPSLLTTSVTTGGAAVPVAAPPGRCDKAAVLGPIPPGSYEIALVARDAEGAEALAATCTADVAAGLLASATCTTKP